MQALIVDGYNIIHAWPALHATLRERGLEDARRQLVSMLAEYAAQTGVAVTVVFDAHGRAGAIPSTEKLDGVTVLFGSKRATADHVIERAAYRASQRGEGADVVVATDDRLERDVVGGDGRRDHGSARPRGRGGPGRGWRRRRDQTHARGRAGGAPGSRTASTRRSGAGSNASVAARIASALASIEASARLAAPCWTRRLYRWIPDRRRRTPIGPPWLILARVASSSPAWARSRRSATARPESWESLRAGGAASRAITHFDASRLPVRIAGEVKGFDAAAIFGTKEARRGTPHVHFAMAAAREAALDSGLDIAAESTEIGVLIASGIGGLEVIENTTRMLDTEGARRVSPFAAAMALVDMAPGMVSIDLGARGPNMAVVSACASGADAIGQAANWIRQGDAVAVLAGGTEAGITSTGIAMFAAARALSTRNDDPEHASRPFERDRDGFVAAEGSAVLVLEEREHALAQGRDDPCGAARLRGVCGRVPHHRAGAERRRRHPLRAPRARACRGAPGGHRVHQRARHRDAAQRPGRDARHQARVRRICLHGADLVDQVDDRAHARRRRARSRRW